MPANNDYPVYNGIAPSWADMIVRVSATGAPLLEMKDITALNDGSSVEVGVTRAGGRVRKRTTGEKTDEASMTLTLEGFQQFERNLMVAAEALGHVRGNQVILSLVVFEIQIQHTPPGSVEIYETLIKGCRFLGRTKNRAQGVDADLVEVTLNPIEVVDVVDGKEAVLL